MAFLMGASHLMGASCTNSRRYMSFAVALGHVLPPKRSRRLLLHSRKNRQDGNVALPEDAEEAAADGLSALAARVLNQLSLSAWLPSAVFASAGRLNWISA
jgi:hypothetical protein